MVNDEFDCLPEEGDGLHGYGECMASVDALEVGRKLFSPMQ